MWNHCQKDWNWTVSCTKWKPLSLLGVVHVLSLCSTFHQCFTVFLMTLAVTITSGSTHLTSPVTRLACLMMFILQSGMLTLIVCKFRVTPMKFYVGLSFSLTEHLWQKMMHHQGSECPHFTFSMLPRNICNQAWAWHPLGFIPKFESHHSCGQNMQALHLVLTHILSGLRGIQEIGGLTTVVLPPLLSQQITLTFKVPIAFIVGDVEGHDKHCGRYKVHHNIDHI